MSKLIPLILLATFIMHHKSFAHESSVDCSFETNELKLGNNLLSGSIPLSIIGLTDYCANVIKVGFENPQINCEENLVTFDLNVQNQTNSIITLDLVRFGMLVLESELYDAQVYYNDGSTVPYYLNLLLNDASGSLYGFNGAMHLRAVNWEQLVGVSISANQTLKIGSLKVRPKTHVSNDFLGHIVIPSGNILLGGTLAAGIMNKGVNYNWVEPANPVNNVITTNCPCVEYKNLTESNATDLVNHASNRIISQDTVGINEFGYYRAGDCIILEPGFEVIDQGTLDVDIETCPSDCLDLVACEGAPCIFPNFEVDSLGNRYKPNQVMFTFPDTTLVNGDIINTAKGYLDSIFYAESGIDTTLTTIERCLCEKNIMLYEVDPTTPINEECCNGSSAGRPIKLGDAVFTVNHFVDAGLVHEDEYMTDPISDMVSSALQNQNQGTVPRVAILDSGINPETVPDGSLNLKASNQICDNQGIVLNDYNGWNFIDDNNDILDNRGHGTAVFFSYLSGLHQHGLDESDQASLIIKVLDDCGVGTAFSVACGVAYAEAKGVDIINASWGLGANNPSLQMILEEVSQNVIIVTSAGNSSQNNTIIDHYPSGYAYDYTDALDKNIVFAGLENVYEVSNICRSVMEDPCDNSIKESLWAGSNYRTAQAFFAEPGVNIELAIDEYSISTISSTCNIVGTSYAAPQFVSGLVKRMINNQSMQKDLIQTDAKEIYISSDLIYYSLILENETCN